MPSSPNYVRDYKEEAKTAKDRGEDKDNAARHVARRAATKLGMVHPGDGKDLDHTIPLSQGGSNKKSNWRVRTPHANRGFARNPDGSMKAGANG